MFWKGLCISQPLALCLAPGPGPGPQPWPPICVYRSWCPICIYRLCPLIFIYRPWLPICFYLPWPTILLPVCSLTLHISTLSFQFLFALAHNLYYRSGTWIYIYLIIVSTSSGSSNSSSSNLFGINNNKVNIPILVN